MSSIEDLLEKSYAEFFIDNFDFVLLNKLTYSLSSGPLYTSVWSNFYDTNIFLSRSY